MKPRIDPRWLWLVAAVAWLVCLTHLGIRLGAPYWLDEFSTLWVIENGMAGVVERTFQIQGQSPLYYSSMSTPQLSPCSMVAARHLPHETHSALSVMRSLNKFARSG